MNFSFYRFFCFVYGFLERIVSRAEEVGYVVPTPVQSEALPVLFSGRDCVIHAQVNTVDCYFNFRKLWFWIVDRKKEVLNFGVGSVKHEAKHPS